MSKFFTILLFFPIFLISSPKAGPQKTVLAFKLQNEKITLDGKLNEAIWQNAKKMEFTQRDPNEGTPASEESEVLIAYDEFYLYIAAKLRDSKPHEIDVNLSRRDNYFTSDWFGFYVDPYNDKKSGYFFGVNAGGSIVDGILFNDSWDDSSWDGIWEAKTSVDQDGWCVEMKIPFSQLRFTESEHMTWGVNFERDIKRNNEKSYFIMVPKNESGFVSRFASLEGLKGIKSKNRFEVLPYVVQKAQYLQHDANDPFYKSDQYKTSIGADLKVSLSSSLNLDATINPDFGQVEVDPAVINLTAFESYFEEKRPFFIEGSSTFYFGIGGANNNWGFNFGWPELFYSRRIGRAPSGSISSADYVKYPTESRILGAAKLTGKLDESTTIGAVSAVTERTYATLYNNGIQTKEQIEPLTHYGVFRLKRELNNGMQSIGFMGTTVNRSINNDIVKSERAQNAFAFGVDGYSFLDESKLYVITGAFAGTYLHGSKEYMQSVQERPYRYFQRPDATYATFDPNITSLSGWYGRVMLNKQEGDFYINAALGAVSPGFEQNDLGFQWMADRINGHLVLGYRWFQPDGFFRRKMVYLTYARSFDFEGNSMNNFIWFNSNFQFMNFWGIGIRGNYAFDALNKTSTRGGPLVIQPSEYTISANIYSDEREKVIFSANAMYSRDRVQGDYLSYGVDVEWRPSTQLQLSVGPSYDNNFDPRQWVGNFDDVTAINTYGTRYVFANIHQETISGNIRLNWTFTPTLSLQLFLQPLLAVGRYDHFKELSKPRSIEYNEFGKNGTLIDYDENNQEYTVDPDGNGSASSFSFSNPDFNFKSLRGNAVLRWEAVPGSIFYFVWSHNQQNYDDPGYLSLSRDFKNLWKSEGDDVFMIKFSYWLDI